MRKILIFGNSGSGKSTLAKQLQIDFELPHLDLDTLAWMDINPPQRKPLPESATAVEKFIDNNPQWVIEGCYADLISITLKYANEMIFLNPGLEICINNCKNRPWEPHKYKTKADQDKNLDMLLEWIKQYPNRDDEFSLKTHRKIFDSFSGKKVVYTSNTRNHPSMLQPIS